MLSAWCLLRGLSTIFHVSPASGIHDRGKEFSATAGPASKTKTQTVTDVGSSTTAGGAKTRDSVAAAGRPATGKM